MTDEEYNKIFKEALVDTYDDHKAIAGFAAYLGDTVSIPAKGSILGSTVNIIDFAVRSTQVLALIKKDDKIYQVDVMSIDFLDNPLPVAAYKKWQAQW